MRSTAARVPTTRDGHYAIPPGAIVQEAEGRTAGDRAVGSRVSLILADHRSLTFTLQPTLYWFVSGHVQQIEHQIFAGHAATLALHARLLDVSETGPHALSLAQRGIRLLPDVPYRRDQSGGRLRPYGSRGEPPQRRDARLFSVKRSTRSGGSDDLMRVTASSGPLIAYRTSADRAHLACYVLGSIYGVA